MKPTEEQLNNMSDEELFELLDKRSKELNENVMPLPQYHCKLYTVTSELISSDDLDSERLEKAREIGFENAKLVKDTIQDTMLKNGIKEPNLNVKNIKTHRSQWFD